MTRGFVAGLARLAGAIVVAGAVALGIAAWLLRPPVAALVDLARFLAISGTLTLVASALLLRFAVAAGKLGLRPRVIVALVTGSGVALINVLVTAWLMFISPHDLGLLLLLLLFSLLVSLSFAAVLSRALVEPLLGLAAATRRLAAGDLATRVPVAGGGELAALANGFNRMAERVELAFRMEREVEESRRSLVASVSHDLRSPLASVRAVVEALHDGVVSEPDDVRRYITSALHDLTEVSALIDDLFELARLDSGAITLQLADTALGDLVSDTLESMRIRAERRGVHLDGAVHGEPVARVDAAKMQRVLDNLVENALRHTPPGGSIQLVAREEPDAAYLDVSDTGEGIGADDLPRVFDRFYRGDPARQRSGAGAGLGLAIVRGFVEAHGGTVWAESRAGQGATFTLCLPYVATAPHR